MNKSRGRNPSPLVRQHIQLLAGRPPKCHSNSPDVPGVCHISPARGDTGAGRQRVKLGETRFYCSQATWSRLMPSGCSCSRRMGCPCPSRLPFHSIPSLSLATEILYTASSRLPGNPPRTACKGQGTLSLSASPQGLH